MAQIIDGKKISQEIKDEIKEQKVRIHCRAFGVKTGY